MIVAVIDEGRRVLVVGESVFTIDLRDGERVEWLDGGYSCSDVWYATLHTNQRSVCLLDQTWIASDFVDAEQRILMNVYSLVGMEHIIRCRARAHANDQTSHADIVICWRTRSYRIVASQQLRP